MGGRQFAQYNKAVPEAVTRLLPERPMCFIDPRDWENYLLDVHRGTLNDPPNRQRLIRGQLPAYCQDCTAGYRQSMQRRGLCHPPSWAETTAFDQVSSLPACAPVSPGLAAGGFSSDSAGAALSVRTSPAARVAGQEAAEGGGAPAAGSSDRALGLLQPEPAGNAQAGDASPGASRLGGSADTGGSHAA